MFLQKEGAAFPTSVAGICLLLVLIAGPAALGQTNTDGKLVYETNCLACHQIDGSGVPSLNPSLQNTSFVAGDKKRLIGIILNGLSNTEVDGQMYDNPMPPFAFLSDEEVASVLTYVRSNFTNKAGPVDAKEVAAVRKATK